MRNLSIVPAVALAAILLISAPRADAVAPPAQNAQKQASATSSLSSLKAQLSLHEKSGIKAITLKGSQLYVDLSNGEHEKIYVATESSIASVQSWANEAGVPYNEEPESTDFRSVAFKLFMDCLPLIVIVAIGYIIFRKMSGGTRSQLSFGNNRAKLSKPGQMKRRVTFKDVAGIDEVKEEVMELVEFLRNPAKFQRLGGRIPKGVLLTGDPGTGKTLLARAIAGEANVPFFSISGSDFVEMFVGVGASRVRSLFEDGKKHAPCIIFIDEIDAIGRHRGSGRSGSNDEREQTLNQLLVELDGFDSREGIILVGATNRPDVLDSALLRPGRFDRRIMVPKPDLNGREAILMVHCKNVPLHSSVNHRIIARGVPGLAGADLANLVNEAALRAAHLNRKEVTAADFEFAKDKILMGPERRSIAMSDEEKENTAWHEGGHVVCALAEEHADPIHKATIIPRGSALGMMVSLPDGDKYSRSKAYCLAKLVVLMGGRAAEELKYTSDFVSTGAGADIDYATDIARKMVTQWGMSKLGMVKLVDDEGNLKTSEFTAQKVDEEIKRLTDWAYERAIQHLTKNRPGLDRVGAGLLEYETLDAVELRHAYRGEPVREGDTTTGAISDQGRPAQALPAGKPVSDTATA